MTDKLSREQLRAQAEEQVADGRAEPKAYADQDLAELVHELRVHQVELEMQNEALRQTQFELSLARDEFADLYDRAPVGYFTVDSRGRISRANGTAASLLAAEPAALVGRPLHHYVARQDQNAYHLFVLRLLDAPGTETTELTLLRDGETFRARVDGVAVPNSRGDWRAIIADVTAERRTQAALAESEARYRQLVEYSPAAIYEVELPGGRLLTVNDVMAELTGYSRAELLSMTGFDLTDDAGRALFAERLKRMAAGEPVPDSAEYRVKARDGHEIWALIHTRLIIEDGRPARIFVVGHDITERKRAEEDLRLIVQGTAALTGRDFFRALVRHLSRLLDARYVLVGRLESGGAGAAALGAAALGAAASGAVHTQAVWADGDWVPNFSFDLRDSACAPVVRGETCTYLGGARDLYPDDPLLARWPVDSYRALPLRDERNETQGVLIVMNDSPLTDSPRTDPILNIFADRAAAELTRQAAEVSLRRYADQQAALYTVAGALTSTLEPAEMLDRVLGVVMPLFAADVGWVTVAGSTRDDPPAVLASRGLGPAHGAADVDLVALGAQLDACPACAAYRDSAGHAALRVAYDCEHVPADVVRVARLRSQVCLPLVAHGSVLGSVTLGWRDEHAPEHAEERLMLAVGYQVAMGLYNARLYQHTRQINRLFVLAELNDALVATLDLEQVARVALQAVASAAGATQAVLVPFIDSLGRYPDSVLALDGDWLDVDRSDTYRGWRPLLDRLRERHLHQPVPSPQPVRATETAWNPRTVSRTIDEMGAEFLVVPIDDRDQPLADLVLSGRTFTDDDVAVAWAAAGRIAQAIRNAQLYEQVRRLLQERAETQAQLVHSEKMAALGRLTASVSHEINNPVQAVLGCLGLAVEELDEDADQATVDRYLSIAMQELRRIASIVRRMREFYRPAEHEWDVADVNETLTAVVDLTRNDLLGRDVYIELDLGQVPPVPIRPDQIRQVFLNLVLNASDAMAQGGRLTLRTRLDRTHPSRRGSPAAVRIEFEDTGTGMPADVRARLFEPFFTTKRDGSGLGLYISHGIVEAHGGEIEVDSREGAGTTVRVWLPLEQTAEAT